MKAELQFGELHGGGSYSDSPVLKLLIQGRERIEKGWCQGAYRKAVPGFGGLWQKESYCMLGSVDWHTMDTKDKCETGVKAVQALGKQIKDSWVHGEYCCHDQDRVAVYNDWQGRTKREVLHIFDLAIAAELGLIPQGELVYAGV